MKVVDLSEEIKNDSVLDVVIRNSMDSSTHEQLFSFLGDL